MSNLSELIPAGGGQNNTDFVADGAITSGKPVILNSAGTVSPISASGNPASLGSPVDVAGYALDGYGVDVTYDSANDKIVAVYVKDSDKDGYAVVGSYSGTAITWGTPVKFYTGTTQDAPRIQYDTSSGKVLITYDASSSYLYGIVGTVSGTSISFGTPTTIISAWGRYVQTTYDSANGNVIIAYKNEGASAGEAKIATISGTGVSFSSAATYSSGGNVATHGCAYDSNAQALAVLYNSNSNNTKANIGTSDGSSITFGSETEVEYDKLVAGDCSYDSVNQKVVFVYRDLNATTLRARVGTLTGGSTRSVSLGTEVTVESNAVTTQTVSCAFNGGTTTIVYTLASDNYQRYINGTVSGTNISFNTAARLYSDNATSYKGAICTMSGSNVCIAIQPSATAGSLVDDYGYGIIYSAVGSNLTATNLLGIASAAILDTATGTINTWGSRNEVQTSLTIGSDYYVQEDGTITTASASPAQLIGQAITATQINIKDYTG